jgi:hypothetical protein
MLESLPHRWLEPLEGLERDPSHRYRLGGHVFPVSVTGVLAAQKSAIALERIEATRADWEPRGVTTHRALELAATVPGWHPDDWPACWPWIDWIWPLLTHPLWQGVKLCASEMGLYSLELDVAGTFDGAYLVPKPGGGWDRILFDLKTQGRADSGAYCTRAQLGGYITLAAEHGIHFDGAATLWARPGRARVTVYGAAECREAWQAALASYRAVEGRVARARAAGVLCASGVDPFSL